MIKVCYIIGQLGRGGAERQLFELLKGIDRDRFEPVVVSLSRGGPWAEDIRGINVQVIELERTKKREFTRLFRLRKILNEMKPEIVHTYLFSANSYGRIAAALSGVPVIVSSERNLPELGKDKDLLQLSIDRLLAPLTDGIVCNSYKASDVLIRKYFYNRKKIFTVHNGIGRRASSPAYQKESKTGVKVIGTVGRLYPQKNQRAFLEMARIILRTIGGNIRFLIVGGGPLLQELQEHSAQIGVGEHVLFLGERSNVREIMMDMDVFVMTSLYEGLSNTIMEAMSVGLPVVATDAGGNSELVIDGVTGFLCPQENARQLAEKVIHLITNEEEAKKMGEKARERITDSFSTKKMIRGTEDIYIELLHQKLSTDNIPVSRRN